VDVVTVKLCLPYSRKLLRESKNLSLIPNLNEDVPIN
jgi:hypothetical protein